MDTGLQEWWLTGDGQPVLIKTLGALIQRFSSLGHRLVSLVAGSWMKPSQPIAISQYRHTKQLQVV